MFSASALLFIVLMAVLVLGVAVAVMIAILFLGVADDVRLRPRFGRGGRSVETR